MIRSMQDGLFRLCSELIENDIHFQNIAEHKNFKEIDENLFYEYQLYRLKKALDYVYKNSRFYKGLFDTNNFNPKDFDSINDMHKIPFTQPEDIAENNFGFLCISQGSVEKPVTFYSSGTTGLKKRLFFSNNDIQNILKFLSAGMNTVTDENGKIQIILPNANNAGIGNLLCNSLKIAGMNAYVTDMMDSSEKQIQLTIENKPDVWFGDTYTIYRITKEMKDKINLKKLGVKVLFLTMNPAANSMVNYLEKEWNCKVFTHYGLTEMGWGMAVDCNLGTGYHYNELNVIAEVVDPITGKILPYGEEGELVYTSLGREAMPLIRYRSHDFGSISNNKCACGSCLKILSHVKKRKESIIKLASGNELYPAMLEEILLDIDEIVDYKAQIDLKSKPAKLYLDIETTKTYKGLSDEIYSAIKNMKIEERYLKVSKIQILQMGELKQYCFEKKLIRELDK